MVVSTRDHGTAFVELKATKGSGCAWMGGVGVRNRLFLFLLRLRFRGDGERPYHSVLMARFNTDVKATSNS